MQSNVLHFKKLLLILLTFNVFDIFISLFTFIGPPPTDDKTPILLINKPAPAVPNKAPPRPETYPVIKQSLAIVCFKLTLACTQLLICVCTSDVTFVKYGNLYFVITLLKLVLLYDNILVL